MKRFVLSTLVAAFVFAAPYSALAAGNEQDMAKITCKEFLSDESKISHLLMWIDGYLSAKSDNTIMSNEWIEKLGMHLGMFCAQNPGKTIMQAIDAMPDA